MVITAEDCYHYCRFGSDVVMVLRIPLSAMMLSSLDYVIIIKSGLGSALEMRASNLPLFERRSLFFVSHISNFRCPFPCVR